MIHNKVEEHAQESYQALRQHFPDFCGCEICQADVLVYALNRLPARYVASEEGRVITELALEKQQNRVSIEVALMEGFRKVMASPRCKGKRQLEP
ncbi:MAG TPA: late competence development ComFB family protein [Gemmatimonadales bacterium]|jgi:competence protein ComFB|nr:late competence development ComFB family protein [Gemmatimonadales bacterium]